MASTDWLESYSNRVMYSDADLLAEAGVVKKLQTGFASLTSSTGKSVTAANDLSSRQAALSRVLTERGLAPGLQPRTGLADFSGLSLNGASNDSGVLNRFPGPTSMRTFTRVFGDGSNRILTITHGLGTTTPAGFTVLERATGRVLSQGTEYGAAAAGPNDLTLTFATAPGVDALAITIVA